MGKPLELLQDTEFAWLMVSRGLRSALLARYPEQEVIDIVLDDVRPIFQAAFKAESFNIVSIETDDDVDRANASIINIVMYMLVEVARCKCELLAIRA